MNSGRFSNVNITRSSNYLELSERKTLCTIGPIEKPQDIASIYKIYLLLILTNANNVNLTIIILGKLCKPIYYLPTSETCLKLIMFIRYLKLTFVFCLFDGMA